MTPKLIKRDYELEKIYEGIFLTSTFKVDTVEVLLNFNIIGNNCHISLSSGNKRKHLNVFEDKLVKNKGCGIGLLLEVKDIIREFIDNLEHFKNLYKFKNILVGWSDKRRRDIYERGLRDLGFKYSLSHKYGKVLKYERK